MPYWDRGDRVGAGMVVLQTGIDGWGWRVVSAWPALRPTVGEPFAEGHLSQAYAKLGIRSRTQLAAALSPPDKARRRPGRAVKDPRFPGLRAGHLRAGTPGPSAAPTTPLPPRPRTQSPPAWPTRPRRTRRAGPSGSTAQPARTAPPWDG